MQKITKHQALANLYQKQFKKSDIEIESGFEGDSLWADDHEQWDFMRKEDAYAGWKDDEEIKTKVYFQDNWYFWWSLENDGKCPYR